MDSNRQIEDQAAAWLARYDLGNLSDAEQAELDKWLRASTAHRIAYLRLEAAWEEAQRLQALAAGTQRGAIPPRGEWRVSPFFDRREGRVPQVHVDSAPSEKASVRRWLTLAASIVLAIIASATYVCWPRGNAYETPVGGTASIPLRDGSNITLNTATSIRVALGDQQRRIELEKGEAYFDVAHDPARPFIVEVGKKRVIAVGTKFSVRRDRDDIRVTVTEGAVRLESDTPGSAMPEGGKLTQPTSSSVATLKAGTIARSAAGDVVIQKKTLREAEDALSWRTGYLNFDETTLADAVTEFNRYTPRKIYIRDPNLAAIHINGKFRATNVDAFVRVLHEGFGIAAQASGETITLTSITQANKGNQE